MNDTGPPLKVVAAPIAEPQPAARQDTDVLYGYKPAGQANHAASETSDEPQRARHRRPPTECGDLPFLIRRDGTWLYRGTPINRKELVCLFASVLKREADGSWWLETPAERGRIEVEDAPFVAVELDWTGDGPHQVLSFRTNTDQVRHRWTRASDPRLT